VVVARGARSARAGTLSPSSQDFRRCRPALMVAILVRTQPHDREATHAMNTMTVTEFFSYLLECDASRELGAELRGVYSMRTRDHAADANDCLVGAGR